MKELDITHSSSFPTDSPTTVRLSRRRLVALLAASAATITAQGGCGGDETRTPGGYKFPGAKKDGTGNYRMRNI